MARGGGDGTRLAGVAGVAVTRRSILFVAYPFAPVGPDAVGGAEQVLATIERAMVASGYRCRTIACVPSRVAGELIPLAMTTGPLDAETRRTGHERVRAAIARAVASDRPDLIHLHGVDFTHYVPSDPSLPTLVTLHLPVSHHDAAALRPPPPHVTLQPVSERQRRSFPAELRVHAAIPNGVVMPEPAQSVGKHGYALALGRICPEKGFHLAIEACRRAGVPLVLAGRVFPYADHERYFRDAIAPMLGAGVSFAGPVAGARKRRLLAGARCLVVPSLVDETSSLVAMEALAAGTPVVARPAGALVDVVDPGVTGFLARSVDELAEAIRSASAIDPEACRRAARERFSATRMIEDYTRLYERIIASAPRPLIDVARAAQPVPTSMA